MSQNDGPVLVENSAERARRLAAQSPIGHSIGAIIIYAIANFFVISPLYNYLGEQGLSNEWMLPLLWIIDPSYLAQAFTAISDLFSSMVWRLFVIVAAVAIAFTYQWVLILAALTSIVWLCLTLISAAVSAIIVPLIAILGLLAIGGYIFWLFRSLRRSGKRWKGVVSLALVLVLLAPVIVYFSLSAHWRAYDQRAAEQAQDLWDQKGSVASAELVGLAERTHGGKAIYLAALALAESGQYDQLVDFSQSIGRNAIATQTVYLSPILHQIVRGDTPMRHEDNVEVAKALGLPRYDHLPQVPDFDASGIESGEFKRYLRGARYFHRLAGEPSRMGSAKGYILSKGRVWARTAQQLGWDYPDRYQPLGLPEVE